jgi:hypothetical protein
MIAGVGVPARPFSDTELSGKAMSTAAAPAPSKLASWQTPMVLIAVGCVIALIAFGPRSALGQFLAPL